MASGVDRIGDAGLRYDGRMTRDQIPNLLTLLRLVLAGAFFAVLVPYRWEQGPHWLLVVAAVLFVLAAATDALDGHLARLWHVESKFGRIMDPFCDKVLVIGALVFLAGPAFADGAAVRAGDLATQVSGVYPWMVVLIIARELLVTGIRGELEGSGVKFGANLWGKLKMILQSAVVPTVLIIVLLLSVEPYRLAWLQWVRDVLVWATIAATLVSGLPYLTGAMRVMQRTSPPENPNAPGAPGSDEVPVNPDAAATRGPGDPAAG
jgi:CDP-diacylglycerol--glycerol-3-phosphate 3-phosphatidyltransferase